MSDATIHLRNGPESRAPYVHDGGVTWCGRKLLDRPIRDEGGIAVHSSYGNEVSATDDPERGTCLRCRTAFDAAYAAAFPEGPVPFASFRLDSPEDMEMAKELLSPATITRYLGPGGEGMDAYERLLSRSAPKLAGEEATDA